MRTFSYIHTVLCTRVARSDRPIDMQADTQASVALSTSILLVDTFVYVRGVELRILHEVEYAGS